MHKSHRRSTKVCTRCRGRKTKCDFKFPQCTPCKAAGATCMGFDPTTRQAVARSMVKSLEAQVAELEAKVLSYQATPQHLSSLVASKIAQATISFGIPRSGFYLQSKISPTLFTRPSCPPLALSLGMDNNSNNDAEQDTAMPLANAERTDAANANKSYTSRVIDVKSIPSWALESMIRNYTDTHLPQYPCIPEAVLNNIVKNTLKAESDTQRDATPLGDSPFEGFVLFIVLAISALTMTWKDEHHARAASESFYKSALKHLQVLEDFSEIRALQISLLLAHYAHMCPERVDNWTCIANAVRIVLELGLHLEFPPGIDAEQARLRSTLFWVTYGMERSLCSVLRLPLSFPEEVITTTLKDPSLELFPDATSQHEMRKRSSANHIYRYRALETEVHRFLYLEEDLNNFNHANVDQWVVDITSRLEAWYSEAQAYTQYNMLEFKHVQYHHLKLRIYRPTPRLKSRTPEDWVTSLQSAQLLIGDYTSQERRSRLLYPWHGAHILWETTIVALYTSWSLRDHQTLRAQAVQVAQVQIPSALQVLQNIGQRWNEATRCAQMLQPLATKVAAALQIQQQPQPQPPAQWSVAGAVASPPPPQHPQQQQHLSSGPLSYQAAEIADEIESLLFSDKNLSWNRAARRDIDFGMGDNALLLDNVLVDDLELLQWAPEWEITWNDML